MASTDLAPYAASSLKERMIQVILEREDVGFLRWTPKGIYEQAQIGNPDLYPEHLPNGSLDHYSSPEFMDELSQYRQHRYLSRLPAHMMADTIARRIIDLAYPLLISKLEKAALGQGLLDDREVRMLLKDAIGMTVAAGENLRQPATGAKGEKKDKPGMTLEEAEVLMSKLSQDRREVVARLIANQLLENVNTSGADVVDIG